MGIKLLSVLGLMVAVSTLSVTIHAAEKPPNLEWQPVQEQEAKTQETYKMKLALEADKMKLALEADSMSRILSNRDITVAPGHRITIQVGNVNASIDNTRNQSCCVIC